MGINGSGGRVTCNDDIYLISFYLIKSLFDSPCKKEKKTDSFISRRRHLAKAIESFFACVCV